MVLERATTLHEDGGRLHPAKRPAQPDIKFRPCLWKVREAAAPMVEARSIPLSSRASLHEVCDAPLIRGTSTWEAARSAFRLSAERGGSGPKRQSGNSRH